MFAHGRNYALRNRFPASDIRLRRHRKRVDKSLRMGFADVMQQSDDELLYEGSWRVNTSDNLGESATKQVE